MNYTCSNQNHKGKFDLFPSLNYYILWTLCIPYAPKRCQRLTRSAQGAGPVLLKRWAACWVCCTSLLSGVEYKTRPHDFGSVP